MRGALQGDTSKEERQSGEGIAAVHNSHNQARRRNNIGELERSLIEHARRLGFARCGIAAATPADGFDRLRDWVERGFAGEMDYLKGERTERRRDPRCI